MSRIYMDANATAKTRPAVLQALSFYLRARHGNPSSVHFEGRFAKSKLREARQAVADLLQLENSGEVIFTSGGTEACNSLVRGFLHLDDGEILASAIEHQAMRDYLEILPGRTTFVSPASNGIIDPKQFCEQLTPQTSLAVVMLANNETGAIQPVATIARMLRARGFNGPIVSDATQAVGKYAFSCRELFEAGVSAIAVSGHKFGSLPGVGAMVFATGDLCFPFAPSNVGGPQESRLRAGTENMPGIISMGVAAQEARSQLENYTHHIAKLRDMLWEGLSALAVKRLTPDMALPNTLLVQFPGCRGDDLVVAFDVEGLSASTGAACSSGKQEASAAVRAQGLNESEAREVVRFSLDWDADESDVEEALRIIREVVERNERKRA